MKRKLVMVLAVLAFHLFPGCKKDRPSTEDNGQKPIDGISAKGIYTDSVFYVQSDKLLVKPEIQQSGTYTAIPEGLELDAGTGEIDVNKSETGLKYRVTLTRGNGLQQSSTVIISGINYEDKIYNLSKGDSIALPIYNADATLGLPGNPASNTFDEKGGCKKAGILVDRANAKINLAASVRSQAIDTGATEQVKLAYRISDGSKNALNGLELKIYFYRTEAEIPQYLLDLLAERKKAILNNGAKLPINQAFSLVSAKVATKVRSRPPCIIVVSR